MVQTSETEESFQSKNEESRKPKTENMFSPSLDILDPARLLISAEKAGHPNSS